MIGACDDDQVARESVDLRHGVFTYYLLEALKMPEGNQQAVSVHSLYERVAQAVRRHTNGEQVPIINGRSRTAKLPILG